MSDKKLTLAVDFVGVDKLSATTRALAAASTATRDKIKGLKDEVGRLNKGLADAKSLRAATESLKKHKEASRAAAANLAALKAQIVAGEAPTKKLVTSIQAAEKRLFKMQDAEKKAATGAKELVASMRGAGVDIARLGQHEAGLTSKIDRANHSLKLQNSLLDGNDRRLKGVMRNERMANSPQQRRAGQAGSAPDQQGGGRWANAGNRSMGSKVGQSVGLIGEIMDYAKAPIDAGANFESLMFRLRALGLSAKAVNDLVAYANTMDVAGSSRVDNLRYILEAQGAFRETGDHTLEEQVRAAKTMAPLMARLMASSKAMGQELSPDQERYFLRFIEQAGGMTSPQRAADLTNGLFRALISSGGNVDPSNYQTFLSQAGSAGQMLSSRAMFADFEPLIAEMHEKAGTALNTTYKRIVGGALKSTSAAELVRLGIWDKNAVEFNSLGGVKRLINGKNPLGERGMNLISTDPVEFYRQIILPSYAKAGIGLGDSDKERQRRIAENMVIFGGTGSNLFNLIDKQMSTILKSRAAYDKTMNLTDAHTMVMGGVAGAKESWVAAVEDWKLGVSEGVIGLSAFSMALGGVTSLLKGFVPSNGSLPTLPVAPAYATPINWPTNAQPRALPAPLPAAYGGRPGVDWSKAHFGSVAPAAIRPAASAAASRGPVTINVHPAPGQSPDAIANHVIRKMDHAQGVAARSNMNGGDGR